jgi:uncharacterized membrane protein YdbT with pleckstrin-like domain
VSVAPGDQLIYSGHPSWKSMLTLHFSGGIFAVLGGGIAWLAGGIGFGIGVFILLFAITLLIGFVRRMGTIYTITDRHLYIRHGIFSRREQQTTIDRVQNVSTRQTMWERVLRIGTLDFDTAGTDQSQFAFVGVGAPRDVVKAVDEAQRRAGVAPPV